LIAGAPTVQSVGGWLFVAASALSLYVAAALMLDATHGARVLPVGRAPLPQPVAYDRGDPGVKVGQ
jgi:succinate-acetate transporter protein